MTFSTYSIQSRTFSQKFLFLDIGCLRHKMLQVCVGQIWKEEGKLYKIRLTTWVSQFFVFALEASKCDLFHIFHSKSDFFTKIFVFGHRLFEA